jgi:hypothetical protein
MAQPKTPEMTEKDRMPWPKEYFDLRSIAMATKPHDEDERLKIAKAPRTPPNE